jgi:pilus assembly protein CpaB
MARLGGNTRVTAIVLAVVLAGVAAWALWSYIQGVEARTQQEYAPLDAFVATGPIPAGTTAEAAVAAGLIERRSVPQVAVPEGAIGELTQIEGLVTVVDLVPGEVIVADRFAEAAATTTRRGLREIPPDMEAVSVEVTVPQGVAGFIAAGDQVSIVAEVILPAVEEGPVDPAPEGEEEQAQAPALQPPGDLPLTQYLLQDVEVLAVGRRVVQEGEEAVQPTEQMLMTLALVPADIEKLVFANNNGVLHFTLLPPESPDPEAETLDRPVETPGRTYDSLFDD